MTLTTNDILHELDHSNDGKYRCFITLNHPYIYLIDSRLNIFSDGDSRWAVVGEVLGYNPRGGAISLELFCFGNCEAPITASNGEETNSYHAWPVDFDSQIDAIGDDELLGPEPAFLRIRGEEIPVPVNKQDYIDAGIELNEYEPGTVSLDEAGRLLITQHQDILRATDEELYQYLPPGLPKILVIDEWFHKEFSQSISPFQDQERYNQFMNGTPAMKAAAEANLEQHKKWNEEQWESRPGAYETWQQIAEVIVTCDPSRYRPTLAPNNHWTNWPESGAL